MFGKKKEKARTEKKTLVAAAAVGVVLFKASSALVDYLLSRFGEKSPEAVVASVEEQIIKCGGDGIMAEAMANAMAEKANA